ncbi:unnamed protein product [Protopolystoma xenopodis]|uniref:Uncharacterized protein n=1 Tax=Protopolystoma xenopodis TaxID=117903 RepID=A0A448WE13_9PLAT|nr:unnamed protein product [Protopolystoma xenopodis]
MLSDRRPSFSHENEVTPLIVESTSARSRGITSSPTSHHQFQVIILVVAFAGLATSQLLFGLAYLFPKPTSIAFRTLKNVCPPIMRSMMSLQVVAEKQGKSHVLFRLGCAMLCCNVERPSPALDLFSYRNPVSWPRIPLHCRYPVHMCCDHSVNGPRTN